MKVKLKPLGEQTMVITGPTSGIGLTTARMAARKGVKLVLASRSEKDLRQLEEEINSAGGQALAVVADVGSHQDVHRVSEAAIERFGGFDTWVNNAGVTVWPRLLDVADEDHRKLFETTFWGMVYGSTEAARHLRQRGGAIINVGSVASDRAFPLQGMYCAAKHAMRAYTDVLRMELEEEDAPVSVTLIKPAAINTPYVEHGKNVMEEAPKLPPPVYPPEAVAEAILHAAVHPTRDLFVGGAAKFLSTMGKHAPRLTDLFMERSMFNQQKRSERATERQGALHRAGGGLTEHGSHPGMEMPSLYTKASMHPWITGLVLGVAGAAIIGLLSGRSHDDWEG